MYGYVISGLSVSSDLVLPGLIEAPVHDDAADVTIRQATISDTLPNPTARGPNWQIAGGRMLIAVPGIVRMLLHEGRSLVYTPDPAVPSDEVAIFISGTGFGLLLHQRDRIVLHASAVRVGSGAALFCGPSGAGKSTLAAALVDAGHDLLADDFCGIVMAQDGVPMVHPDGRQLKLWQNAIDRLALVDRRVAPVRAQIAKYYVEPREAMRTALPITAIYMLREARLPGTAGIAQPNLVDGAMLVRGSAYRPAMVERMGQAALYFRAAAVLAQTAGVFTLTREMDFARLPAVIGWLEAHWRARGLTEMAA